MTEKSYIEKSQAYKAMVEFINPNTEVLQKALRQVIDEISPADVEPVIHGEWVYSTDDLDDGNGFRIYPHCSNCGRAVYRHDAGERCCRCGARMRGENDA